MPSHNRDQFRQPSEPVHRNRIVHDDCLNALPALLSNSVDLICTDPPYGIGFMNQSWDRFGTQGADRRARSGTLMRNSSAPPYRQWWTDVSRECLRVLKPGAFMFVVMTPRQDSLARAIIAMEDAGFVIGFTSLYWTYASGFPKAINIGKAVDKRVGVGRSIPRMAKQHDIRGNAHGTSRAVIVAPVRGGAVSAGAKRLDGAYGGFQPKPAVEVVIVAMKPLTEKTYVDQALANGKGITWLADGRIPTGDRVVVHDAPSGTFAGGPLNRGSITQYRRNDRGRFPANLLVSDEVLNDSYSRFFSLDAWAATLPFLIVPKAGKREKAGWKQRSQNGAAAHPTVKPLKLMMYLITLGSRPGDLVLDPFLGSGTAAVAAELLGRRYVGIEREATYVDIARARIAEVSENTRDLRRKRNR